MPKKKAMKTTKNNRSVDAYIKSAGDKYRADGERLVEIFSEVTKCAPRMWGTSIVGYGSYEYSRADGSQHEFMATGFSLRKSGPVLYIMPGYQDYSDLLKDLGPHKLGKACLYLKGLEGIHLPTLKKLIRAGLRDLKRTHSVTL